MADPHPSPLPGGMMNTVVRRGDRVLRTAPATAAALHPHLRALPAAGFDGAPRPLALNPDGREELGFVEGEVALPPFPDWIAADTALASAARLLRRYHDAAARIPVDTTAPWPADLADPRGGTLLCHNDPCAENLVFRHGSAAALIDFDLAAPGRPLWDVAALAYYLGPTLPPEAAAGKVWEDLDTARRLRLIADTYGLTGTDRALLPQTVEEYLAVARRFVAGRVAAGEAAFVRAHTASGGWARWDRRRDWLADQRPRLVRALTTD
ncbi:MULTISPECIES: phosphotransferase [unclassified Nocardiopsis]|uniref:phosphotransferase n=1 Tax=Nocardiopsis TaxID=2013 RepID=UPI00387B495A